MEFWGHEVKPGITVSCEPGCTGGTKKGSENVVVCVKVGDKKSPIGTLSTGNHPQISCDLIFREAFDLSHNSKTASVFLCGYKVHLPHVFGSDSFEDKDEELKTDEFPVKKNETQKSVVKFPAAKDGKKDKQDDGNESDDSETSSGTDDTKTSSGTDDSTPEDDSSDEDDMSSGTDDSSGDDSEAEETPVKPDVGKKRAVATALKTPASDKKAKISTPKETGGKNSVHVANGKQKAPKTPADSKAKEKSSKSGSHSCKKTLKITVICGK